MKSRIIFLGVFLLLGMGVLLALVVMVVDQESIASINTSQLVDDINAGRVTRIKVGDDNKLTVTMRDDDTRYKAQLDPTWDDPLGALIDRGADVAALEHIDFEFQHSSRDFPAVAILLPVISVAGVLVGLGWMLGRRSGDPRKRKPKLKNDWV